MLMTIRLLGACMAEAMRALTDDMRSGISKHVMHEIVEGYECLARMVEARPDDLGRFAPARIA